MTEQPARAGAPRFPLLGSVLTVAFITLTGLAILVWVSLTLAVGSEAIWLPALVLALVPALLIAWAARLVFVAVMPRPPAYGQVAVVVYVVVVLVAVGSVWLADNAFRAGEERAAQACSLEEAAALRGIALGDALAVEPAGERDGSCTFEVRVPGDRDATQAAAVAAMTEAGFTEVGNELGVRTYERDGITVVVAVAITDDTTSTPVTLSVPGS